MDKIRLRKDDADGTEVLSNSTGLRGVDLDEAISCPSDQGLSVSGQPDVARENRATQATSTSPPPDCIASNALLPLPLDLEHTVRHLRKIQSTNQFD